MKSYTFPYFVRYGPLASAEGVIDVELTDEEAKRMEDSAHEDSRWRLYEDNDLEDIYDKVLAAIIDAEPMLEEETVTINYPEELQML